MLQRKAPSSTASSDLAFGRFVIQSATRQVLVDNQPAKLGACAFDVLMTLIERRDCVVSKNELLDAVWLGLIVEENNLQAHVSALRKLLGSQTIMTISGRGYRFSAPQLEPSDARPALPIAAATPENCGNLPAHLSPLLGRDTKLSALSTLLLSRRLITITGSGGMGQTRLAQAAAFAKGHDHVNFPDGVWLVECAQVNSRQLVLARLARTLGVAFDADGNAAQLAARLAERKMLLVISQPGALPRCRMLESARAFALQQVNAADELAATTRRLAQSVLGQFEKAFSARWTGSTNELLASTLPDIDNLRAALIWATGDAGDAIRLASLVGASRWLWKPANHTSEGLRWFRTSMQHVLVGIPADIEARLLLGYANALHQTAADKALAALHRPATLYRSLNDTAGLYETLCVLTQKQIWQHDLVAAEKTIDEVRAALDPKWPPVMRAGLLTARIYWLQVSGRTAEGEPLMAELVTLMRALGDERKLDHALMQMAESLFVQGKAVPAIALRREVMQRICERRFNYAASNLGNLCAALTFNDELDETLRVGRAALPLVHREGSLNIFADHFALLACKLGHHAQAARLACRANANIAASGFEREQSELRAARMTEDILRHVMSKGALNALMNEGSAFTDEAAIRAALGIDRRSVGRAA